MMPWIALAFLVLLFHPDAPVKSAADPAWSKPFQQELRGKVIRIVDGDTFEMLLSTRETVNVRLDGIDAPERGMPFATVSKNYLAQLCFGKQVRLDVSKRDRWKRPIAKVYVDGSSAEVGEQMVRAGMAWHFTKYSNSTTLDRAERDARIAKRGLWADPNPVAPWLWRKAKRR
jgi:endonuclease YncB( thermonuclease family)